jgi:hypothetical protein
MRPPDQRKGPTGNRGAETTDASNVNTDHSTAVIVMARPGWHIAMRRAHAIRKYRGTAKVYAVKLWRVAVVDALEARP